MLEKVDISSWAEIIPVQPTKIPISPLISGSIFTISCLLIFSMSGIPFALAFWYKFLSSVPWFFWATMSLPHRSCQTLFFHKTHKAACDLVSNIWLLGNFFCNRSRNEWPRCCGWTCLGQSFLPFLWSILIYIRIQPGFWQLPAQLRRHQWWLHYNLFSL